MYECHYPETMKIMKRIRFDPNSKERKRSKLFGFSVIKTIRKLSNLLGAMAVKYFAPLLANIIQRLAGRSALLGRC